MSPARDPSKKPRSAKTRRRALSAGVAAAAALLAGCVDSASPAGTSASPTTDPATTDPATTRTPTESATTSDRTDETTSEHYHSVELTLTSVTERSVARGVLRGETHLDAYEADLIEETIAEGSTSFSHLNAEPLRERTYVSRDAYYEIRRTVVDRRQVEGHLIDIDAITTCSSGAPEVTEDPVDFDSLSPRDQRTFTLGSRKYYDEDSCFSGGRKEYYTPEEAKASTFLNESPTFVRYDDDTYRIVHEGSRELTLTEFRFEATKLGDTEAEYVDAVVPEVVWHVDVDALTADEREFFDSLLETGSYYEEDHVPDVVHSFMDRAHENAYRRTGRGGFFLEHEGAYYRLEFEEAMG